MKIYFNLISYIFNQLTCYQNNTDVITIKPNHYLYQSFVDFLLAPFFLRTLTFPYYFLCFSYLYIVHIFSHKNYLCKKLRFCSFTFDLKCCWWFSGVVARCQMAQGCNHPVNHSTSISGLWYDNKTSCLWHLLANRLCHLARGRNLHSVKWSFFSNIFFNCNVLQFKYHYISVIIDFIMTEVYKYEIKHAEAPLKRLDKSALQDIVGLYLQEADKAKEDGSSYKFKFLEIDEEASRIVGGVCDEATRVWSISTYNLILPDYEAKFFPITGVNVKRIKVSITFTNAGEMADQEFYKRVKDWNPDLDLTHWTILGSSINSKGKIRAIFLIDIASYNKINAAGGKIMLGALGEVNVYAMDNPSRKRKLGQDATN